MHDPLDTPRQYTLTVPRTARYATLGPVDGSINEVWFVFHGYGQLAHEFLAPFKVLDDGSRLIVAPEGLSRFYVDTPEARGLPHNAVGASWMTREARDAEIDDYVRYLDLVYETVSQHLRREDLRVHLLGFSQGVATATRWAVLGCAPHHRLILWSGLLPPDLDRERVRARLGPSTIFVVYGEGDPYVTAAAVSEQERRWEELGLEPTVITFDGGHRLSKAVLTTLGQSP